MKLSETATRVLVAAVGVPVVLLAVYVGGWLLAALLALVACFAALEFFRMVGARGVQAHLVLGGGVAVLFVVLAARAPEGGPEAAGFGLLITLATLAGATLGIWSRGVTEQPLLAFSATITGAIYTGGLLSFALFLRHLPGTESALHGAALLVAPIFLTWTSDTFAYFVGRAFGTRKLIPKVSPGKTVQGAIGAVVGTILVAVGYSYVLGRFPTYVPGVGMAIAFGLLISVAAQVGDLAESLFKRDAGVKDSGALLPGHGGALDRFDSLIFTLPIGYLFFRFVLGPGAY